MKKIDKYIKHIEDVCGTNGHFYEITDKGENPSISVTSFINIPEPGCTTAFSFGLSSVAHPQWINSRPELVISVNSLDSSWPLAMGELIRNGRDRCIFSYGMILNFGRAISNESSISCFLVYACTILEEKDLVVRLSDRKIHLSQLYPIYESEISMIKDLGVEKFVHHSDIDLFDIKREPKI